MRANLDTAEEKVTRPEGEMSLLLNEEINEAPSEIIEVEKALEETH
jgi:hypothetical protein